MEIQDGTVKFKVRTKISKEEVQEFADKFIIREDVIPKAQCTVVNAGQLRVSYPMINGYKPFIVSESTSGYPCLFQADYKAMSTSGTIDIYMQTASDLTTNRWNFIFGCINTITIRTIFIKDE